MQYLDFTHHRLDWFTPPRALVFSVWRFDQTERRTISVSQLGHCGLCYWSPLYRYVSVGGVLPCRLFYPKPPVSVSCPLSACPPVLNAIRRPSSALFYPAPPYTTLSCLPCTAGYPTLPTVPSFFHSRGKSTGFAFKNGISKNSRNLLFFFSDTASFLYRWA